MRPLRFLLALFTCIIAFILLLSASRWHSNSASSSATAQQRASVGTYFDWRSPSSLFPPSAIISLTDDNSTFFMARPAAFGPFLPAKSLSAPLWVGSGFGDQGAEGELGCSDIPGWEDSSYIPLTSASSGKGREFKSASKAEDLEEKKRRRKRDTDVDDEDENDDVEDLSLEEDGTDDHLHHSLSSSNGLGSDGTYSKKPAHADIQSLQEAAEISGKVVLLSRGGCGFLEKVKWAQRRGAIALIVGDDIPGGPLVIMYAKGDTSNVTIPAIFTSHTTAHLLSSLIPSGDSVDGEFTDGTTRLGLAAGKDNGANGAEKKVGGHDGPVFTSTSSSSAIKATSAPKHSSKSSTGSTTSRKDRRTITEAQPKAGWLRSLFGSQSSKTPNSDSSRPPSSGNLDWVLLEDSDENEVSDHHQGKIGKHATTTSSNRGTSTKRPSTGDKDGFVIGVQDWRDPDMVAEQKERLTASSTSASSTSSAERPSRTKPTTSAKLEGGSITPGSGEYVKAPHEAVDAVSHGASTKHDTAAKSEGGWIWRLFHHSSSHAKASDSQTETAGDRNNRAADVQKSVPSQSGHRTYLGSKTSQDHDGLWVTLTPSTVSASPFFDTLLVLVVSPLITLTVVYALLLLRSRIRRRRWRAPKSVVERLPVRTYRTMASSTPASGSSSYAPSIISVSALGPTTPLLSSPVGTTTNSNTNTNTAARPFRNARPRSRTASAALSVSALSSRSMSPSAPPHLQEQAEMALEEKRAAGLAEWRRRYGGKQRECVVCLEEYVDGVSRVMSLPCGHEFHEGCITPWLTTRRRTCPICKGDVVRSLTRPSLRNSLPRALSQPSASSSPSTAPPPAADAQIQPYSDYPSNTTVGEEENSPLIRTGDEGPQRHEQDLDLEQGIMSSSRSSLLDDDEQGSRQT